YIGLTTALDGVTVDNRVASRSGAYVWPKGEITIRGEEALTYVRQRYELPGGDLDRAERQRAVVKAILTKMMSANVIA
ncbi:LCP family protein, partial [Escherichia coli]|uniref:LCP family protein n=1 Tax=Escherichia coli TaxID=562 RepID=UPI0028E0081F